MSGGCLEAESSGRGGWLDGVAHTVDDDVVVVPAEGGEVVGVGSTVLGPGGLVVGLEPISADASVCAASSVTVEDCPAEFGWDDPSCPSDCEWLFVVGVDVFDCASAEDLLNRLYTNTDS